MREKSREGKMPVYSRYDSDIKKGNKKNGGRGVGRKLGLHSKDWVETRTNITI